MRLFILVLLLLYSLVGTAGSIEVQSPAILKWDKSVTENVTYDIYTKVNTEAISLTECALDISDLPVDKTVTIRLIAVSKLNIESDFSNVVIFTPIEGTTKETIVPPCNGFKRAYVAINWMYNTRPMKDFNFNKTDHRIKINTLCESKMIKQYSATDSTR